MMQRRFFARIAHDTINRHVKDASYAVRGPIVTRSQELASQLKGSAEHGLPFSQVIPCNIGNPHSLDQAPLSYIRDVLSLVINPSLAKRANFNKDVVARAENYLKTIPSVGAYSESQGITTVREEVAQFLHQRDGIPSNSANIFLTNGASDGVRLCLQTIMRGKQDGILTPIPQYPLYSALITLLNGKLLPYHLDESGGWSVSEEVLDAALLQAKNDQVSVRGLVVINPGNPTGQIMPRSVMEKIVRWCRANHICLMADEVYQENIWDKSSGFVSFRKVAYELNAFSGSEPPLQLISFHSISKGFLGECGLRGGYFELLGVPDVVKAEIYKLASISLCSNTIGQIATGLMVRPPVVGEDSYSTYISERDGILDSLHRRSKVMKDALNSLEGVSCTDISGALYAFPTIRLPQKAIEAAHKLGMEPDALYCMELLESTGIVVVPGSGFGQVKGTYHFRTTILPPEDKINSVITLLTDFHHKFLQRYR